MAKLLECAGMYYEPGFFGPADAKVTWPRNRLAHDPGRAPLFGNDSLLLVV